VLSKYCNGEYGFDEPLARNGTFQFHLISLIARASANYVAFNTFLKQGTLEYIG